MKPIISASILNSDFGNLENEIIKIEEAGVDWIHLDIMDGQFVPNISFGPHIVSVCKKITNLPLDVHLMICDPDKYIKEFSDSGADNISVHIENNPNIYRTLQNISSYGKRAGIVVNPGTPIESIFAILNIIDYALVMSVNPGFGGQNFLPGTLKKIKKLSDELILRNISIPIEVDGGINEKTAKEARISGANILVAGSYIFKNPKGIKESIRNLKAS
ncbi:MAG: ribulose-phosphate 3-epimerase [Anaerolineaceae bacterium]|nr:ribulose-phosphate 3-epimerase [Anaerolineaceae bacterium]